MTTEHADHVAWDLVRDRLHAEGLRWTPQRRTLVQVLSRTDGHVTGAEVVETLGYVSHHHGIDGREEYHVLPADEHGHLHCHACGGSWEIQPVEADAIAGMLDTGRAFTVDRSHITITGTCAGCARSREDAALRA